MEKALKERMIHSVMPRIIADDLMKQGDDESENSIKRHSTSSPKNRKKKPSIQKTPIIFRPFKMQQIEQVSILFADIVGFTKMSANIICPRAGGAPQRPLWALRPPVRGHQV